MTACKECGYVTLSYESRVGKAKEIESVLREAWRVVRMDPAEIALTKTR
jgi:hypothetical protein